MGLGYGHTDIEGCEYREDESLDVGHQTLKQRDEDAEEHTDHTYSAADGHTEEVAEDEDDDDETKDDDMAGRHVGKKSNHKHNGLGEDTHELDHGHQGKHLEPCRNSGSVEDVLPIVTVTTYIGYQESDNRQGGGDGDIAGDVGTCREERNETQDVAEEDEEE